MKSWMTLQKHVQLILHLLSLIRIRSFIWHIWISIFAHSTNGVAALHTQILKESELAGFYQLYPEKFNNKTNGITFRRWLLKCNPALTSEIESLIGSGFKKDASELKKLLNYTDDAEVLKKLS